MSEVPPNERFRHCPGCGETAIARHGPNAVLCPQCGFTLYFNPNAAAGVLIEDGQGNILAARRAKDPARGKLAFPGGFVGAGESAEEALAREVKEEVNLALSRVAFLASFPNTYVFRGVAYPTLDLFFVGGVESFGALEAEAAEVAEVLFVDPRRAAPEDWAFPSLRKAVEAYLNR